MSSARDPAPFARLILYDDEASADCRRVRMAIMSLDLDVEIRPCPRGGTRFRAEAEALDGTATPPLLVDPNHGVTLDDAADIVAHLRRHYGPEGDARATVDPAPSEIELYAYETCFFCARVRDALSTLELPYTLRSMGPGSAKRDSFRARHGKTRVPFLRDSSTATELFESVDIVRYLRRHYGR
jgi:glutathione S-transferase